ncbi:MAG: hypothetical protein M3505_07825 [Verrucomicrobiota bacterium]|nr:hypothetical protein [Verrucomicrobiota bacterium]
MISIENLNCESSRGSARRELPHLRDVRVNLSESAVDLRSRVSIANQ